MDFRILGSMEVWDEGRSLALGGLKQRALLAILLINANTVVLSARLIELLWEGEPPPAAANAIQVYVTHLRRILEPTRKPEAPYKLLVHRPQGYELRAKPEQVDAIRFERALHAASQARARGEWQLAADTLGAALAAWRGPALPEFASARFALPEIGRLEELRLRAVEDRIDADLNLGRHADLVPDLRQLVAEHPLRERLCGQLILALYRSGLQAQASDIYHRTRARLVDELGMEPGPPLERLFRDILRQAGYLEPDQIGPARHNLPHPLTRFIGRGSTLKELLQSLRSVRLLTLTGAGGIGKTRLAIQLARLLLHDYPDGVWLIDLAPISDPDLIAQVVAAELNLQEQPGRPLVDTVAAYMRDRRALLVLDNCERVLDASAEFALAMLTRCSGLKIIATSRQRLRIAGEQVWHVPPLAIPNSGATIKELSGCEAIQLILDRAALVCPGFRLTDANAWALTQICLRLDGIPLALELAAARMGTLSPSGVAARLDERFSLLVADERGRPARHQTLQAALEWSYYLLDRSEQLLFRRLGIFSGSFDIEAVKAVCIGLHDPPGLTKLTYRLVDKSMVLGEAADRFRLLETIRDFAKNQIVVMDEASQLGGRHAEHFLNLVKAHGGRLRTRGARQHVAELDRNIDNLRAALEWASAKDRRLLAELATGLYSYWLSRCSFRDAHLWLGLAIGASDGEARLRSTLLACAGWIELISGEADLALMHNQQALAAAQQSGDARAQVRVLINLSEVLGPSNGAEAFECLERACTIAQRLQDREANGESFQDQALLAGSLCMLGAFRVAIGKLDAGQADLVKGTLLSRQAGDYFLEALAHCWQSEVALGKGDHSTADVEARRGLELGMAIDHRFVMLRAIAQLAAVAADRGLHGRALRLAAAVDSVRGATGATGFDHLGFWFGQGWPIRRERVLERLSPADALRVSDEASGLTVYEAAAIALAAPTQEAIPASLTRPAVRRD